MGGSSARPQDLKSNRPKPQENNKQWRKTLDTQKPRHLQKDNQTLAGPNVWIDGMNITLEKKQTSSPLTLATFKNTIRPKLKLLEMDVAFIDICFENYYRAPEINKKEILRRCKLISDTCLGNQWDELGLMIKDKMINKVVILGLAVGRNEGGKYAQDRYKELVGALGECKDEAKKLYSRLRKEDWELNKSSSPLEGFFPRQRIASDGKCPKCKSPNIRPAHSETEMAFIRSYNNPRLAEDLAYDRICKECGCEWIERKESNLE